MMAWGSLLDAGLVWRLLVSAIFFGVAVPGVGMRALVRLLPRTSPRRRQLLGDLCDVPLGRRGLFVLENVETVVQEMPTAWAMRLASVHCDTLAKQGEAQRAIGVRIQADFLRLREHLLSQRVGYVEICATASFRGASEVFTEAEAHLLRIDNSLELLDDSIIKSAFVARGVSFPPELSALLNTVREHPPSRFERRVARVVIEFLQRRRAARQS